MIEYTPAALRTIHGGLWDTCNALFEVYPHRQRATDVPEPSKWEGEMHTCPVCGEGTAYWDSADAMTPTIPTGYREDEIDD